MYPEAMKFRVTGQSGAVLQICFCLFWIVLSAAHIYRRPYDGVVAGQKFYTLLLVFYCAALAIHVYFYMFGVAELSETGLTLRQGLRRVAIPYASIVSARRPASGKKAQQNTVELEIARLSHDIYPHQYKLLHFADAQGFLMALRQHLSREHCIADGVRA